jgi:hypothetical protein
MERPIESVLADLTTLDCNIVEIITRGGNLLLCPSNGSQLILKANFTGRGSLFIDSNSSQNPNFLILGYPSAVRSLIYGQCSDQPP